MRAITPTDYRNCEAELAALGLEMGSTYSTTIENKIHLPVVNGCYGLNVLHDPEHPEITADHLAMFRVSRRAGFFVARYFATAEDQTYAYVRPGVIHRVGVVVRELVEPDVYDGYQLRVAADGDVQVSGVQGQDLVELPAFEEFPDSAAAFVAATRYVLRDRASVTAA